MKRIVDLVLYYCITGIAYPLLFIVGLPYLRGLYSMFNQNHEIGMHLWTYMFTLKSFLADFVLVFLFMIMVAGGINIVNRKKTAHALNVFIVGALTHVMIILLMIFGKFPRQILSTILTVFQSSLILWYVSLSVYLLFIAKYIVRHVRNRKSLKLQQLKEE